MTSKSPNQPARPSPPSKHQLALMIWVCVFPTLTAINLVFGDWLRTMQPVSHLRARHDRCADRDLRVDAVSAPAARAATELASSR